MDDLSNVSYDGTRDAVMTRSNVASRASLDAEFLAKMRRWSARECLGCVEGGVGSSPDDPRARARAEKSKRRVMSAMREGRIAGVSDGE